MKGVLVVAAVRDKPVARGDRTVLYLQSVFPLTEGTERAAGQEVVRGCQSGWGI